MRQVFFSDLPRTNRGVGMTTGSSSHCCSKTLTQALRDAASNRPGGGRPYGGGGGLDDAPVLSDELKRHLAESRGGGGDYRGGGVPDRKMEVQDQDEMGPIRIRNLEDLIRLLEGNLFFPFQNPLHFRKFFIRVLYIRMYTVKRVYGKFSKDDAVLKYQCDGKIFDMQIKLIRRVPTMKIEFRSALLLSVIFFARRKLLFCYF